MQTQDNLGASAALQGGLWRSACLHQPWPQLIDFLWDEVSHIFNLIESGTSSRTSAELHLPYCLGTGLEIFSQLGPQLSSWSPHEAKKSAATSSVNPWHHGCVKRARGWRAARVVEGAGSRTGYAGKFASVLGMVRNVGSFTLSVDGQMCRCGVDRQGRRCCALDNSEQGRAGCAPLLLDRAWPP